MLTRLTRTLLPLLAATSLLNLGGCTTAPEVRADYDRTADFSTYKTFGFVSPLGTDRGGYQSVVSQHLKAATQREMEARGMRFDATAPQLLVNFSATLSDKLRVTSMPSMYMGAGYYGYRGGMYSAWPLYHDTTTVTQYKEGTLNIDVVDAARKQLVWEGVVVNSVTQEMLDDVPAAVNAAVKAAFVKYPVPAAAPAAIK
jgi:Domain of unknown function (DUF4136)